MGQNKETHSEIIEKLNDNETFGQLRQIAEESIDNLKERLVSCPKEDIDVIRGMITGIREILLV